MDQVLAVNFSLFDSHQLVTCGKQHVTFWELEGNKLKQSRGRLRVKTLVLHIFLIFWPYIYHAAEEENCSI